MLPITLIKRFVISIILLSAAVPVSFAMTSASVMAAGDKGIYVRGIVTDASDGKPLEYANITALDTLGNLTYQLSARNFNPLIALAADITLVEPDELVETGELQPDHIVTPGAVIDHIIVSQESK